MKKLGLDVGELNVQSFATEATPHEVGTVHAAGISAPNPCLETLLSCARQQTRANSCVFNCECTNALHACIGPASTAC